MKYFLDTEFHEGFHKPFMGRRRHFIDLISIGIVAEDGRKYYAVCKDFDVNAAWNKFQYSKVGTLVDFGRDKIYEREYWLRDNVLKRIFWDLLQVDKNPMCEDFGNFNNFAGHNLSENLSLFKRLLKKHGKTTDQIKYDIMNFIFPALDATPVEFWGYYADYDWVVFCAIFGTMMDLPEGYPMFCMDLKQLLDEKIEGMIFSKRLHYSILGSTAHLLTLKEKLKKLKEHPDYPKQDNEHNAANDADWNQRLFEFINKL